MAYSKIKFTVERIKEALDYNADTGSLTWKIKTAAWSRIGDEAGSKPAYNGYRYISLDKKDILAHRVAWIIMTGEFPKGQLTFGDDNRLNLKWENLLARIPGCKTKHDHKTPEGRSAYGKAFRIENPKKYKDKQLQTDFGITLRDYEDMLIKQEGKCAICNCRETTKRRGKEVALAVDHDHVTGHIRSLLCNSCNQGLGQFKDNPDFTQAATHYLHIHKQKQSTLPVSNVIPLKRKES